MTVTQTIRLRAAAALVALAAAACACSVEPSEPEQRYELTGTIVAVDRDAQKVTVRHDAIPGLMEAMTMPFRVRDGRMMHALEPGRQLSADLVVAGKASWLENLVVTTQAGPPSLPSRVEGSTEPVPGEPAPEFALVDQDGKPASLARFRGKAVALTFIYTRCPLPDYCPLMTNHFAAVSDALATEPPIEDATALVSITVDPEYDTPEVLRGYARAHTAGADGRRATNWEFLTGDASSIRRTAESYGLVYETEGGQVIHTLRTAVIAPDGRLVKVYRGNEWTPDELARDLREAAGSQFPPF
jgi:protein SCO1/2